MKLSATGTSLGARGMTATGGSRPGSRIPGGWAGSRIVSVLAAAAGTAVARRSKNAAASTSAPAATSSATTWPSWRVPRPPGASSATLRWARSPRILRIQPVHCACGPCSTNTRTPSAHARSITRTKSIVPTIWAASASAAPSADARYDSPVAPL